MQERNRIIEERATNTARRRKKNRALARERIVAALETTISIPAPDVSNVVLDRAAAAHAREVAFRLQDLTGHQGLEFQQRFFSHLLTNPLLLLVLLDYVSRSKKLLQCEIVCDGFAQAWKGVKSGYGKDKALARRVIEAAVIFLGNVEDDDGMRAATSCIGMNKRSICRAVQRGRSLDGGSITETWALFKRKKRSNALTEDVIELVQCWWAEETRVSPCKKDVRKLKCGTLVLEEHVCHWLEESQVRWLEKPLFLYFRIFVKQEYIFSKFEVN